MRRYNSFTMQWEDDEPFGTSNFFEREDRFKTDSTILIDPLSSCHISTMAPFHVEPMGGYREPNLLDPFDHPCSPLGNPLDDFGNLI